MGGEEDYTDEIENIIIMVIEKLYIAQLFFFFSALSNPDWVLDKPLQTNTFNNNSSCYSEDEQINIIWRFHL